MDARSILYNIKKESESVVTFQWNARTPIPARQVQTTLNISIHNNPEQLKHELSANIFHSWEADNKDVAIACLIELIEHQSEEDIIIEMKKNNVDPDGVLHICLFSSPKKA